MNYNRDPNDRLSIRPLIGYLMLRIIASVAVSSVTSFFYTMRNGDLLLSMSEAEIVKHLEEFLMSSMNWMTIATNLLCIAVIVILGKRKKTGAMEQLGLKNKLQARKHPFILLIIFGMALNIWLSFLLTYLPIPQDLMVDYSTSLDNVKVGSMLSQIISIVLIAPLAEEILYREKVYNELKKIMNVNMVIIVQGILFGVIHGNFVWVVYASILGMIMGYVRTIFKSVRGSILLHMAFNAMSFLLMFLPEEWLKGGRAAFIFGVSAVTVGICALQLKRHALPQEKQG